MWAGRNRLAVALASLALVMLVSGCGGSSNSGEHSASAGGSGTLIAPNGAVPGRRARGHGAASHRRNARPASRPTSVEQALQRLPAGKRAQVIRAIAGAVFKLFGFSNPNITVTPAGDAVRADIRAADACTATADSESLIAARI